MRPSRNAFHLAIATYDLGDAEDFYVGSLGCKLARRYDDRVTLDFFGDQVVCHLVAAPRERAEVLDLYPRHFGMTFRDGEDFEAVHRLCLLRHVPLFRDLVTRFGGMAEEHRTFVLRDPSDNLVEFKHYLDPRMMH